jgi:hypothetical protein
MTDFPISSSSFRRRPESSSGARKKMLDPGLRRDDKFVSLYRRGDPNLHFQLQQSRRGRQTLNTSATPTPK